MYQSNFNSFYTPANAAQPQMPQQPVVRTPIQPVLKGRPVTSIDEVRATSVDFDGSISYFPDLANNKIYTKQINMDGTSRILMYEPVEIPQPVMKGQEDYITRDEFNQAIQQIQSHFAESQPMKSEKQAEKPAEPGPAAFKF